MRGRIASRGILAGLIWMAGTGVFAASDLDDASDFAQIAKNGFALTVDGAFFSEPGYGAFPALVPNDGDTSNSYSWGSAWFEDALWIGTNRDVLCSNVILSVAESLLGTPLIGTCPPAVEGIPGVPNADQRPEIWRYTPSGPGEGGSWGLAGTWERVFVAPSVNPLISRFGNLPSETPRDIGYRNMQVCDAGDGVERLYVATIGIPGNILYRDGETFTPASSSGLFTRLRDLSSGSFDLGFRAMACFKGRLWVSPAGVFGDADISDHPIVFMNPHPASGESWRTMVDVSDPAAHPLGDPGNIGIFQLEVAGDYLWLSTVNRTTGFELWRGDGSDCLAPWEGDGHCRLEWVKVIDDGAGRPQDLLGPDPDNAGATLGIFDGDLYLGAGDSGGNRVTLAELIRISDADQPPPGGSEAPHPWELLVGWPRRDYADPALRLPGLENLDCVLPGDMDNAAPPSWLGLPMTELDDDALPDDCLATARSGPGLAPVANDPLAIGSINYFWRFATHQDELFVGTLDVLSAILPTGVLGFDLLRSTDGLDWTPIAGDGFGNPWNYGVRTLLSAPGLGLVVGSANPFTLAEDSSGNPAGGTEVFVGTTAPGPFVPPVARAEGGGTLFDRDQDGLVTAELRGDGSTDPFGGSGITGYEWYRGALSADCESLPNQHGDKLVAAQANTSLELASRQGADDVLVHRFTLRVSDGQGGYDCEEVEVTASHNLPPSATLRPEVPLDSGEVVLVDFNGDGSESFGVLGLCSDPEGAVARCELVPAAPDTALSGIAEPSCAAVGSPDADACVSALVTAVSADRLVHGATADLVLQVEDEAGYRARYRLPTLVQPVVDTAGANDPPLCRSKAFGITKNGSLEILLNAESTLCVDPDDSAAPDISVLDPPDHGSLDLTRSWRILYRPERDFVGTDSFRLRAEDAEDRSPRAIRVRVKVSDDSEPPQISIDVPENGVTYFDRSFAEGCGTGAQHDICGTAEDALSGIAGVRFSLARSQTGGTKYWNAVTGAFELDVPFFFPAGVDEGGAWHKNLGAPLADGEYRLSVRASDGAGNESWAESSFTKASDGTDPQVQIDFPVNGASYSDADLEAGCPGGPGICGSAEDDLSGVAAVDVAIQRRSDGHWWSGAGFSAAPSPLWRAANGSTSWHLPFGPPSTGDYRVLARAVDRDGNQAVEELEFTREPEGRQGFLARLLAFFGRFF